MLISQRGSSSNSLWHETSTTTELSTQDQAEFRRHCQIQFWNQVFWVSTAVTKALSEKHGFSFWNADCCIPPAHDYNHIHCGIVNLFLPFQELIFHFSKAAPLLQWKHESISPAQVSSQMLRFLYNTICKANTSKQKGSNSSPAGFTGMTTSYGQRAEWGKTLYIYSWVLCLDW